jgi:hypothetical protein
MLRGKALHSYGSHQCSLHYGLVELSNAQKMTYFLKSVFATQPKIGLLNQQTV